MSDNDWRHDAECLDEDPEIFYPAGKGHYSTELEAAAKAICARCPVQAECLDFAYDTQDQFAVMGGMTPEERKVTRRNRNRQSRRDTERALTQAAHLAGQIGESS